MTKEKSHEQSQKERKPEDVPFLPEPQAKPITNDEPLQGRLQHDRN